jgi:hypothetical protein
VADAYDVAVSSAIDPRQILLERSVSDSGRRRRRRRRRLQV